MKEQQPIDLLNITRELAELVQANGFNLAQIVSNKIRFPDNVVKTDIKIENFVSEKDKLDHYLRLSAYFNILPNELSTFLHEVLEQCKTLELPHGQYTIALKQFWTPQDFSTETETNSFIRGTTRIRSQAEIIDPNKERFLDGNKTMHGAEVQLSGNCMAIAFEGKYRQHLQEIANAINPQIATIQLSKEDAEIVKMNMRRNVFNKILSRWLRDPLKPRMSTSVIFKGGGIDFSSQDIIEFDIKSTSIPDFERLLHKSLLRPKENQESRVVQLKKRYSSKDIINQRVIMDLKTVSSLLDQIAFTSYGNYEISLDQAKILLQSELDKIQKYLIFRNESIYDFDNTSTLYSQIVEKLTKELLGGEPMEPLQRLDTEDYIQYLESQGYVLCQFKEGRNPNPEIIKLRHLLEFYKQVYQQNPIKAEELYRNSYINTKPITTISTEIEEDGSMVKELSVASMAKLYSINIHPTYRASAKEHWDEFSFSKSSPDSKVIHFWAITSLQNPILGSFQQWACDRLGISLTE